MTWSESRRITEWRHRGRCIPLRMGVVQLVGKNPDGVPACESWSAHTLNTNTLLGSKKNAPMGKPPAMFDYRTRPTGVIDAGKGRFGLCISYHISDV